MIKELKQEEYKKIIPIIQSCHLDPTIYAVIEGYKNGRIFVDDADNPQAVYIWTYTEWAYLVGEAANEKFYQSLHTLLAEELLPALEAEGRDFIFNFTYSDLNRRRLLSMFAEQRPLSPGVNIFTFNEERFREESPAKSPLPAGFSLRVADRSLIENLEDRHMIEDFAFYWDSIERYWARGLGYCIMKDGRVVSAGNSDAYGSHAHRINIWTHADYRGRGFASRVGAAFIEHCLLESSTPVYLCDEANIASRRLAESLGFIYVGDLHTVDIPFRPFQFYIGLGYHFAHTLQQYAQAAELYETAFAIQPAGKEDYFNAAWAWGMAGHGGKAKQRLDQAVELGWDDSEQLEKIGHMINRAEMGFRSVE